VAVRDARPPAPLARLVARASTPTTITLAWSPGRDNVAVTGYAVYSRGKRVGKPSSTSFTVRGLACGKSYRFAVAALDAAGNRSPRRVIRASTQPCSSSAPTAPDTTRPTTPGGLRVTKATPKLISVVWRPSQDAGGVAGYRLYRDGAQIATTTRTSATFGIFTCGTRHQIEVEAVDAAGNISARGRLAARTARCQAVKTSRPATRGLDARPPAPLARLVARASTPTTITLAWSPGRDNVAVTGYAVYSRGKRVGKPSSTSFTVRGLACGKSYRFAVAALDAAGNRSPRRVIRASTQPCSTSSPPPPSSQPSPSPSTPQPSSPSPSSSPGSDTTPPTRPGNLRVTGATQTAIAVAWDASSDDVGVTGYRLYRNGTGVSTTTATTASFGGLTCGLSYTFAVEALDAAGNRSQQAVITARTDACPAGGSSDTVPPSVPVGLIVTGVTGSSISLSWTASFDNVGVAGYDVLANGVKVGVAAVPNHTVLGLSCGTGYSLAVAAFDAAGNRSPQAQLSASTAACSAPPPPPPSTGGCTQTISSGLASAIQSAAAGSTICLNAGSYGSLSLSSVSKTSDVTVQPVSGANVIIGQLTLSRVDHLRFTGVGGSMRIGGLDLDGPDGSNWSHHLTFDHATWTSGATVRTRGSNQALLFDSNVFDNLPTALYEGRLSIRGYDNTAAVGVTISNSHFGGGCSDGVALVGGVNGVQIGPGNEFTGITQSGCDPVHADPIGCNWSSNALITGNYFHDNGSGSGGILCGDDDDVHTVTNNVFVCTCIYPWSVFAGGGDNWTIRHNTFAGDGSVRFEFFDGDTPSGNLVRDNVFTTADGISTDGSNYGTNDHNLNAGKPGTANITGTPIFVGGARPTTYSGYRLASGSPGKGAASDGTDMGIP